MTYSLRYNPEALMNEFLLAAAQRWFWGKKQRSRQSKKDWFEAAELLEKLASTVDDVDAALLDEYGHFLEGGGHLTRSEQKEALNSVGWSWHPENAERFIRAFIPYNRPHEFNLTDVQPMGNA